MTGYFPPLLAETQLPSPAGEGGSTAFAVVVGRGQAECAMDQARSNFYLPLVFQSLASFPSGHSALGKPGKS